MKILAVDPGSASTKMGVYQEGVLRKGCLEHPRAQLEGYPCVMAQLEYRLHSIERYLAEAGYRGVRFDAVVGRGGLVRPVAGGVYLVDDLLERDLRLGVGGEHASNLGGVLARALASRDAVPAYVVDPPVIDELWPVARLSGLAGVERKSMFHALNQKASAREAARELGREYHELNLVVAHLGSGITVGAHRRGRVVDVNNGLDGDGPFSPERTGGLPLIGVLELIERGRCSLEELKGLIARRGGFYSYLGTVDLREVELRRGQGDERAALVLDALVYQVAKEIGALAAALDGEVDAIVLTGGLAHGAALVEALTRKVRFLAPVLVRAGEYEIEALVDGALRVVSGLEEARIYQGGWDEDRR